MKKLFNYFIAISFITILSLGIADTAEARDDYYCGDEKGYEVYVDIDSIYYGFHGEYWADVYIGGKKYKGGARITRGTMWFNIDTNPAIRNGWLDSGRELGERDEDGWIVNMCSIILENK